MVRLLVFEFASEGPWGEAMAAAYSALAADIANEPGLHWKTWTEAPERGVAGGVYVFETEAEADAYAAKHAERLGQWGISDIDMRSFEVNTALSAVTHMAPSRPQG